MTEAAHLQTTSAILATLLLLASVGFNKILKGQPWTGRLDELHERMGAGINADGQG